jgi:F0F1-type ATP synthase assembly protein I
MVPNPATLATLVAPAGLAEPANAWRLTRVADAQDRGRRPPSSPRAFVGLGIEMAVSILVFMFIGYRLDVWLGSKPWLFLLGALVGVGIAFYSFFRRVLPAGPDPGQGPG